MRPRLVPLVIAIAILATLIPSTPAAADEPENARLLVNTQRPGALSRALPREAEVVQRVAETAVVEVDTDEAKQTARELAGVPGINRVEPDRRAFAAALPTDPRFQDQWGWHMASVPDVWKVTEGDNDVVVAVLDTGVDRSAADLRGARFTRGFDAVEDRDPSDANGHGTDAAGVIAAQRNSSGSVGVCPNCSIMPVRVLPDDGGGWHSDIAQGLRWAADHGADIANLSLVSNTSTTILRDAVNYATARGVLVVGAAGNAGTTRRTWPAAYASVIGVAAHDPLGRRYDWSSYGNWVRLTAPGCNWSIGARQYCGTSSASPFVAGVAGLLMSADPKASVSQLVAAVTGRTRSAGFVRHGRIDAQKALVGLSRAVGTDRLALGASRRLVRRAEPVALRGHALSIQRLGVPKAKLQVQQRTRGSRHFRPARNVVTNSAGRLRLVVRPRRTTTYRLVVRGHPVRSRGVTVRVR
ncbi:MAG: S8 family serine peptidase [Egibacteraceae bacterium]